MDIYVTARGYIKEWGFSELRKSLESPSDSALVQTADRQHVARERYIYISKSIWTRLINVIVNSKQQQQQQQTGARSDLMKKVKVNVRE